MKVVDWLLAASPLQCCFVREYGRSECEREYGRSRLVTCCFATAMLLAKSPAELPHASTVSPRTEGSMPTAVPIVCSTTTSLCSEFGWSRVSEHGQREC